MDYIIPIAILSLPVLIACSIALFIPVSHRLKWLGGLCEILIFIACIICLHQMIFDLIPTFVNTADNLPSDNLVAGPIAKMGRLRIPVLPTLLYFIIYFILIGGACKIANFKYFDRKIMYVIAPISCIVSPIMFNHGAGDKALLHTIVITIILVLAAILHVIYKKSLKK